MPSLSVCWGSRCAGRPPPKVECPSGSLCSSYAGVGLVVQLYLAVLIAAIVLRCLRSPQPAAANDEARSQQVKRAPTDEARRLQVKRASVNSQPSVSEPTATPPPWWLACIPKALPAVPEPEVTSVPDADDVVDLVPPLHLPFLDVTVETRTALPFPLLTVQTNGEGYGPPDVAMADGKRMINYVLAFVTMAQPFVVMYDFRSSRWPPMALCQLGFREADKAQKPWDASVQGIVIVFDSSIVRYFLSFMIGVLKPPQPIAFCSTPEDALVFLGGIEPKARVFACQSGRSADSEQPEHL